jgi:hypothetical protein
VRLSDDGLIVPASGKTGKYRFATERRDDPEEDFSLDADWNVRNRPTGPLPF